MYSKDGKYFFFWKNALSQWHKASVVIDNVKYNCCEQYMAQKALLFNDLETYKKILDAESPKVQKDLGRLVKNFNIDIWNQHARDIVYQGNLQKYLQHDDLRCYLCMFPKHIIFVEASPFDKIWGVGLKEEDERIQNPVTWQGKNWLGEVITKVRQQFDK